MALGKIQGMGFASLSDCFLVVSVVVSQETVVKRGLALELHKPEFRSLPCLSLGNLFHPNEAEFSHLKDRGNNTNTIRLL